MSDVTEWLRLTHEIEQVRAKYNLELEPLVRNEQELRRRLASQLAPTLLVNGGSKWFRCGPMEVQVCVKMATKIDVALLTQTLAKLPKAEAASLVRYTPALNLRYYKKLPTEKQKWIDRMLITTPGFPTLSVKAS